MGRSPYSSFPIDFTFFQHYRRADLLSSRHLAVNSADLRDDLLILFIHDANHPNHEDLTLWLSLGASEQAAPIRYSHDAAAITSTTSFTHGRRPTPAGCKKCSSKSRKINP
jgi:hypothetical protein